MARPGYAKSIDTRARILAAALEEASDCGIHQTSLAAIAARAGVAIGSLNYHFGSRDDLLRALMASLTTDLLSRLHDAGHHPGHGQGAGEGADFFTHERAGLRTYLAHQRDNPAYERLANEIRLHEPELYRRAVEAWVERIAQRIRAGIAAGELRPMRPEEITALAHLLLGASQFLGFRKQRAGKLHPSDRAVVDTYVELLRNGVGRVPRGRRRTATRAKSSVKSTRPARSAQRQARR